MNPFLDALLALDRRRSPSPLLTWYDAEGRIELSGRVYANWVIKTLNLLVEECEVEPGCVLLLPRHAHWKTLVIAHAALAAGATLAFAPGDGAAPEAADIAVCYDGETETAEGTGAELIIVARTPLALHALDVPTGAVDWTADVRSHSDAVLYVPAASGSAQALPGLTYAAAGEWLRSDTAASRRSAVSGLAKRDFAAPLASVLRAAARGGSVVMCDTDLEASILASENVDSSGEREA
ncbi:hypothetical protein JT358_14370 [Micrococcales bacterium 31B]|nr:hypothetical protein [Micrococcales bacterium 31B]